jgi:hypothetical protein
MKNSILYTLACLLLLAISSCKEEEQEDPILPTEFSFTSNDSLIFETSGTLPYAVSVQCASAKEFGASFQSLTGSFDVGNQSLTIPSNESRNFNVQFNQTFATPGVYTADLSVSIFNENNTPKSKTVYFVYRPNCAYNFRNHNIGQITYVSNNDLLNKNITCDYNTSGQLVVSGLTTFDVVLNFDCDNNTVTMESLVNNGFLTTGSGQIVGNEIVLQMFSNGVLHSNSRIIP